MVEGIDDLLQRRDDIGEGTMCHLRTVNHPTAGLVRTVEGISRGVTGGAPERRIRDHRRSSMVDPMAMIEGNELEEP